MSCCWICTTCKDNEYVQDEFTCKACDLGWWPDNELAGNKSFSRSVHLSISPGRSFLNLDCYLCHPNIHSTHLGKRLTVKHTEVFNAYSCPFSLSVFLLLSATPFHIPLTHFLLFLALFSMLCCFDSGVQQHGERCTTLNSEFLQCPLVICQEQQ